jgi:dienelactone hydrolase
MCTRFLLCCALLACAAQEAAPDKLSRLFDYDAKAPLNRRDDLLYEREGVRVYELSYDSPKGGRVTGYIVAPGGQGPFAGLVFGHWGYGNRTEFLPEAELLAEAGAVSVLIDYPWARPAPWRRSLQPDAPEKDLEVFVQAVVDLRRALDLLGSRGDVDGNRLAYVGHSFGAQWGAILAAVDKRLKAAVLVGGVPDLASIWLESDEPAIVSLRQGVPKEKIDKYLEVTAPVNAVNYVPHAAPVPLLFQFARYERYFNEAAMKRYSQAASEPKIVRWYAAGHELNDIRALADRAAFLQESIRIKPLKPIAEKKLKPSPAR